MFVILSSLNRLIRLCRINHSIVQVEFWNPKPAGQLECHSKWIASLSWEHIHIICVCSSSSLCLYATSDLSHPIFASYWVGSTVRCVW
jgi:hypothetical protein